MARAKRILMIPAAIGAGSTLAFRIERLTDQTGADGSQGSPWVPILVSVAVIVGLAVLGWAIYVMCVRSAVNRAVAGRAHGLVFVTLLRPELRAALRLFDVPESSLRGPIVVLVTTEDLLFINRQGDTVLRLGRHEVEIRIAEVSVGRSLVPGVGVVAQPGALEFLPQRAVFPYKKVRDIDGVVAQLSGHQ